MAFVKGMDLDKLEAFRSSIKANPVILGLEARSIWEGHSGRSTVHIGPYSLAGQQINRETRQYTIPYGAWREVEEAIWFEGPTDRVEPVEMALGAVAACLTNSISLNAPRNGINIDELEIKVRADVDPSVLFEVRGPEDHTSCIPKIVTEVRVKGDITDAQLKEIERLVHYSPVHGMVEYSNTVETKVIRV